MKTPLILALVAILGAACSSAPAPKRHMASIPQDFEGVLTSAEEGADMSPYYITLKGTAAEMTFACYNTPRSSDNAESLCKKIVKSSRRYLGKKFKVTWVQEDIYVEGAARIVQFERAIRLKQLK